MFDWQSRGLCRQVDPELFFPERGPAVQAQQVCRQCPVRTQCLEYAVQDPRLVGIWGGSTFDERVALRRGMTLPPRPRRSTGPQVPCDCGQPQCSGMVTVGVRQRHRRAVDAGTPAAA